MIQIVAAVFMLTGSLLSSAPIEGRLHVEQQCYLREAGPFMNMHEVNVFKIAVENESLLPSADTIEEIHVWADDKTYRIKTAAPKAHQNASGDARKNNQLYGDELKAILNAGFVKLWIVYQKQVNEEHASEGKSPYFTRTKTTVQTERYIPVSIDRSNVDEAFTSCQQALASAKRRHLVLEIAIAAGGFLVLVATVLLIRRFRKNKAPKNS